MIERIYILESVDPVIFYGVNNVNMQLIKTLFPKLRIVARGNVMKVIGDEEESELFLKKIREVEKYCEEFNSLSEDVILDIIKGKAPVITKQENLIIHGMNGKPIVVRRKISKFRVAPQLRFHPRHQLERVKRLRHVIIRADVQSQNFVHIL